MCCVCRTGVAIATTACHFSNADATPLGRGELRSFRFPGPLCRAVRRSLLNIRPKIKILGVLFPSWALRRRWGLFPKPTRRSEFNWGFHPTVIAQGGGGNVSELWIVRFFARIEVRRALALIPLKQSAVGVIRSVRLRPNLFYV
jgi:hypothetical protein